MRRLATGASAALALLAAGAPPAVAGAVPPGSKWHEQSIRSADGTRLHMDVFRPAAGGRTPVILIPSRYFAQGSGADPRSPKMLAYYDDIHARAYARGYSVVQLTPRGYGKSGGCTDWRGPGERADVVAAIRWAATRPWSTGKVGTYGLSYDAALQVAVLGERVPGLAAAVPIGAPTSAYRGFYMRGVRYQPFSALQPPYTLLFTFPPPDPATANASLLAAESRLRNAGCAVEHLSWLNPDPAAAYWRERDYEARAARTRVPTLWSHGFIDWNAPPDGVAALWPRLSGPKRIWLGQHPHVVPSEWERGQPEVVGRLGWTAETFRFFDRYLKGASAAGDPPVVVQEGFAGRWRAEPLWPPGDGRRLGLPVLAGSYADATGNKGEAHCTRLEPHCVPGRTGAGTWTLSPPFPHAAHVSGVPRLRVRLSVPHGGANVVALLYDVDAQGRAALISRGAARAGGSGTVALRLYMQDWLVRRGHRLALLVSGADDWWFEPGRSGASVRVAGGSLSLPFLRYRRTRFLPGGPSQAIRERTTFRIPAPLVARRTAPTRFPAPLATAAPLRLIVRPRSVEAGRRVTLRARALAYGSPLRGALVSAGGASAKTDRGGRARLTLVAPASSRLMLRARAPGLGAATAVVRVER